MALNPELQRHIWLELSSRRLISVPVIIGLLLSPWLILPDDEFGSVAGPATWLYYALVLVWGTRLAANAVVGEIRARTWDLQRLSSLSPSAMLWGKLIGAPILVWYAGAICLIPIVADTLVKHGPTEAVFDLVYYVTVGLFAHSISLLTSLLAVRKRVRQSWLDSFRFQALGIAAGASAAGIWTAARETDFVKTVEWYGANFDAASFTFFSLLAFMIWSIIGNWRLMRRELQVRNSPWVWVGFLLFMMVYYAGFADVVDEPQWRHAIRLAAAGSVSALLTYLMMLLEPKDAVHIRWLIDQFARLRFDRFLGGLQSWMFAYGATVIVALWLVFTLNVESPRAVLDELHELSLFGWIGQPEDIPNLPWRALVVAALLFMTRDMALFLAFNFSKRARRPDFVAIIWLVILYTVGPLFFAGMEAGIILPVFSAVPASPAWLGPVYPAVEASLLLIVAARRLFALDRKASTG